MNRPIPSIYYCLLAGLACLLFTGQLTWGSPSGLNNIPTTDIVPERILVFQTWLNVAENRHPQQFVGFKYGPFENWEIGADWKANDETHGHATLQAKYAFDIKEDLWKGVIGFDNLSDNRKHNGDIFPYVATSLDLKMVRLHFGFAAQPHNEAFFAGVDKTVPFLDRNLQLRADARHINDKEDTLFSVGFLYDLKPLSDQNKAAPSGLMGALDRLARNIVLEGWVSMPSTGEQEVFTLKLNYVIEF